MPFTVKIPRVIISSPLDGLKWSQDGRMVVAGSQHLVILSPTTKIPEEETEEERKRDLRYNINYTSSLEDVKSYYNSFTSANDETYSLTATTSEIIFLHVDWSPSGMCLITRGCLLTALTSRGEVILFEQVGNPVTKKWQVKTIVNQLLLDDISRENGEEGLVLDNNQQKSLRFHSMSWSDRVGGNEADKWGTSFLALGDELGVVTIFEINSTVTKKVCAFSVTDVDDVWVTGLKWSQWSNSSAGDSNGNAANGAGAASDTSKYSVLSIFTSSNQVLAKTIQFDGVINEEKTLTPSSLESILPPGRFLLSIQQWYHDYTANIDILAVARMHYIDVFFFSNGKCVDKLQHPSNSGVVPTSLSIHKVKNEPSSVQITTISFKGDSQSVRIDLSTFSVIDDADDLLSSVINSFVSRRKTRTTDSLVTSLVNFQCFGAMMHPHGSFIALAYTLVPIDKLRYPILSQQSCRVVFLPLLNETLQTISVPSIPSVMEGANTSTWWEIKALKAFLPRGDRESYVRTIIDRIKGEGEIQEDVVQLVETIDTTTDIDLHVIINKFIFNLKLDRLRLLLHFNIGDELFILKLLTNVTLKFINNTTTTLKLSPLDRATLLGYNHLREGTIPVYNDSEEQETIEISGGFFTESFNFNNASDINSITSETGVPWKRCSVTLLPLTSKNILTCEGCQLKRIKSCDKEDIIVSEILSAVDVCMYCGSHYHER